ncbi:hypothetical protein [Paraburkholderia sp. SG-MS1]|uniref:hypothetical protein n=1 Tax=Paraburkholderia sp. SG-MS1 TaxID=2023741 RepID=UPI001446FB98|nr:hypothetical protein [Paraburkholderia sp. SG-MS1]
MNSERQSFRGRERAVVLGASGRIDASLFPRQPMDNGNIQNGVEGGNEKNREWGRNDG